MLQVLPRNGYQAQQFWPEMPPEIWEFLEKFKHHFDALSSFENQHILSQNYQVTKLS